MHQVVGRLDAGQGVRQRLGAQDVAADDLDAVRQLGPRRIPHERADVVPGGEEVGEEAAADVAGGAREEDLGHEGGVRAETAPG